MVNEKLVQQILSKDLEVKLGDMLTEFRRSSSPFRGQKDEEWEQLAADFRLAVNTEYNWGIDWGRSEEVVDPSIADSGLSPDTIVPEEIVKKYIRCNVYCAEFLQRKGK